MNLYSLAENKHRKTEDS